MALEEIAAHPDDPLEAYGRWVLAAGIGFVLFAFMAAAYRVARRLPIERLAAAAAIALVALLGGSLAARTLLVIVAVILVVALFVETVRWKQANPEKYARLH